MQEAFEIPIEDQDTLPIGTVRYGADCFALDVRGDSMDKKFPPGTVLICQPYDPEISTVPENKYVIAMRSSKSTAEVEATVKKLEKTAKGNYVLVPESNNMIHKPEPLEDVGEFSVYVYAVVVAAVNPV